MQMVQGVNLYTSYFYFEQVKNKLLFDYCYYCSTCHFSFPVCVCIHECVCLCTCASLLRISFPCNFRLKTAQFLPKTPLSLYLLFPSRWPFYFPLDLFLLPSRGAGRRTCLAGLQTGALQRCRCWVLSPARPRGKPTCPWGEQVPCWAPGEGAAPKSPVALSPEAGLVQAGSAEWAMDTWWDRGC